MSPGKKSSKQKPSKDSGKRSDSKAQPATGGDSDLPEYEPLTPEFVEEEAIRGDFMLRWAVVLLAILMGSTFIAETQTLVHVKAGEVIASNGFLPPRTDVFSYTAADRPWVNLSWLFDLITAGFYAIGGGIALSVFKAVVAGVTFWFLVNIGRGKTSTWGTSICAAIALVACHASLTALPELMTLLGLAATFWIVNTWKEGGPSRRIWALIPLFLLWSNLDPRMFLGLGVIVLYVLGDFIGVLWGRPVLTDEQRKPFQLAVGCSLLATLINPFGWDALLAPFELYGVEYPAYRAHLADKAANFTTVRFLSLLDSRTWDHIGHAGFAAISLWLAAAVMFILNFKRLDIGQLLIFVGFTLFAGSAAEQLPAAALVFAALASINGRSWYRENFKQSYTVKPGELMFSRGGRAVTVLAIAVLAFMSGTGWLRPPGGGKTGFGLDYMLSQALQALKVQTQETFSDRAFNFTVQQGDMLIWVGQKPFIDMRLPLYLGEGEENLLTKHRQTRESLRIQHVTLQEAQSTEMKVKPDEWKETFDEYDITHAVLRLTSTPLPDYPMLQSFIFSNQNWDLTSLSGAAAVFHRKDDSNEELKKFNDENRYDFIAKAFQEEGPELQPRTAWVAPPSVYERKVWRIKRQIPEPIQQAQHLNRLLQELYALSSQMPLSETASYPAMAWLAIRQAQLGLDEDPFSAEGYVQLGEAYRFLAHWHQGRLLGRQQWQGSGVRFFQAVAAYNQALVADPNNSVAHSRLWEFYNSPGFARIDLALRELTALNALMKKKANPTQTDLNQLKQIEPMVAQLQQAVQKIRANVDQAAANGADTLQQASIASQQFRCPLIALERLELRPDVVVNNPAAQLLQLKLLLEVGRMEEAYALAGLIEQRIGENSGQKWRMTVAATYLANAEFEKARKLWEAQQAESEQMAVAKLLNGLAPRIVEHSQMPWPLSATLAAYEYEVQQPTITSSIDLDIAFSYLETGQVEEATKLMKQILKKSPNSTARNLVTFYLTKMTGELIDPVMPRNRVPVLFAPEDAEPAAKTPEEPEKSTVEETDEN